LGKDQLRLIWRAVEDAICSAADILLVRPSIAPDWRGRRPRLPANGRRQNWGRGRRRRFRPRNIV
jgi:hypothetical protein